MFPQRALRQARSTSVPTLLLRCLRPSKALLRAAPFLTLSAETSGPPQAVPAPGGTQAGAELPKRCSQTEPLPLSSPVRRARFLRGLRPEPQAPSSYAPGSTQDPRAPPHARQRVRGSPAEWPSSHPPLARQALVSGALPAAVCVRAGSRLTLKDRAPHGTRQNRP